MKDSVLQKKREELELEFKKLDAQRQSHVKASESCFREMLKVEGAWQALNDLLPPSLKVLDGENEQKETEKEA